MRKTRLRELVILAAVFAPLAVSAHRTLAAPQNVNGRIENVGLFQLLRVWGTPEEMGFAHGYLLAPRILEAIDGSAGQLGPPPLANFLIQRFRAQIRISDRASTELDAMMRGIVETLKPSEPTINALGRPCTLDDLIVLNARDLIRGFGCSGFTVWGAQAGDAGVITARNFDFPTPYPGAIDAQMILVRQPAGRKQVASITWPGYIGVFTGFNETGVCAFLHDGDGERLFDPQRNYAPLALALMDVLEKSTPPTAQTMMEQKLRETTPYPFSYLVRLIGPRVPEATAPPIRVFRIDSGGLSENIPAHQYCITTNHYRNDGTLPGVRASHWSIERYERLSRGLTLSRKVGKPLSGRQAWTILGGVAYSGPEHPTLHALIVYPEQKRFDLSFAALRETLIDAAHQEPTPLRFDRVFQPVPQRVQPEGN